MGEDRQESGSMAEGTEQSLERRRGGIDPLLLELLVCPLTKSTLSYDPVRQELVSRAARLAFPVRDGIPIMLVDEARELEEDE